VQQERTNSSLELLVPLERSSPIPLRRQLESSIRESIRRGVLPAGTPLPPSRRLAADLGVSRGVVVDAYAQLLAEAWLESRPGSGTRVAEAATATEDTAGAAAPRSDPIRWNLRPGVPDLSRFPQDDWLAAARRGLRALPWNDLGYGDARGLLVVREALVAYLGRVRRIVATPDDLLLSGGLAHGLALLSRALVADGHDTIAVEDPSAFNQRDTLALNGLEPIGVPVDGRGIDVEALRRTDARVVVVTPAHQFPMGVVLTPDRRKALVNWANDVDGLIVEDDYDAEYRYDRAPVGSMQALAPNRVVHGGSLSKSLAPGLRLGWLVAPAPVMQRITDMRWADDLSPPVTEQVALAELLRDGGLDRHLRRTRLEYRRRRDALVAALGRRLPEAEVLGAAAGLQVVVTLPEHLAEAAVVDAARARGIDLFGLAPYRMQPGPPALVLGYASLTPGSLRRAVAALADAVEEVAARRRRTSGPTAVEQPRRNQQSGPAG